MIDPLKADVAALTSVMSQEFAVRNHILAVEVHADRILIGTDQPFLTEWQNNLERSLAPRKIERVLLNPEQLQRYLVEYYQVSRAVSSSQNTSAFDRDNKGVEALLQLLTLGNRTRRLLRHAYCRDQTQCLLEDFESQTISSLARKEKDRRSGRDG